MAKLIDNPEALNDVFEKLIAADLSIRDLETLVSGYLSRAKDQKGGYDFFAPKIVTTKAGSRLRFEPRRRSVRVECNINLDEPLEVVLAEIKRNLKKLARGRLRVVG